MMNEIDRLNELQEREKELRVKWYNQRKEVAEKLFGLLELMNQGPSKLFIKEDSLVNIDSTCFAPKEGFKWKVYRDVYFQDPQRPERYDFGSSFSLSISNLEVKINMGTCGEWGLEDIGQWSRLLLVRQIFIHQEDLIRELDPLIDTSVQTELWKVSNEIDQINRDIRRAKEERELLEIKKKLLPNKYLASLGRRTVWDGNNQSHEERYYYGFEKIIKITEVSVFTHEVSNSGQEYTWVTHRRKLSEILRNLQYRPMRVIDSINEKPEPIKEEK